MSKEYVVLEQLVGPLSRITADLVRDADLTSTLPLINEMCTRVLHVAAAAIVVLDPNGVARILPMTEDRPDLIRLLEIHASDGPWTESMSSKEMVEVARIGDDTRWPDLSRAAAALGCGAVCAAPMILGTDAVGSLISFYDESVEQRPGYQVVVQTLADLTTLSLCQDSDSARAELLARRSLSTFDDRVRYEHSVGMVAGRLNIDASRAAALLREHADAHGLSLVALSRAITSGTFDWIELEHSA
ncbi:GAF domain-containing protein [Nocardia sp. NPDC052254]|uniref:GAF domain-containing protein n=1 Tax=Nocardia sp. NPDC052254 TaxID=3155681 RepID=UPI00342CC7CD